MGPDFKAPASEFFYRLFAPGTLNTVTKQEFQAAPRALTAAQM
jgi:hypothetical protein